APPAPGQPVAAVDGAEEGTGHRGVRVGVPASHHRRDDALFGRGRVEELIERILEGDKYTALISHKVVRRGELGWEERLDHGRFMALVSRPVAGEAIDVMWRGAVADGVSEGDDEDRARFLAHGVRVGDRAVGPGHLRKIGWIESM